MPSFTSIIAAVKAIGAIAKLIGQALGAWEQHKRKAARDELLDKARKAPAAFRDSRWGRKSE